MIKGCEEIKKSGGKNFMATTIFLSLLNCENCKAFFAWAGEVAKGNGKEKVYSSKIFNLMFNGFVFMF